MALLNMDQSLTGFVDPSSLEKAGSPDTRTPPGVLDVSRTPPGSSQTPQDPSGEARGGSRRVQGATLEASENGPKNGGGCEWSGGPFWVPFGSHLGQFWTLLGSAAVTRDPAEG